MEHYKSFSTLFLSLAIAVLLFFKVGISLFFILNFIFFYILIVLCSYDIKLKKVPDYLLLFTLLLSFFITNLDFFEALKSAFIVSGMMVLLNFLVTFYIQNIKAKFTKNEKLKTQTALGDGDIPIIATIGAIFGTSEAIFVIFLSAVIGIFYASYVKIVKNQNEIAYIPSLFFALFLEYFFEISIYFKDFY